MDIQYSGLVTSPKSLNNAAERETPLVLLSCQYDDLIRKIG